MAASFSFTTGTSYNLLGRIPLFEGIFDDLRTGFLWALFGGVVIFIVRWRGTLLDLDELEDGGRGGLGLHRARKVEYGEPSSVVPSDSPSQRTAE